jgi:predicted permease
MSDFRLEANCLCDSSNGINGRGPDLPLPVMIMAAPTAVVSYIMARELDGDEKLAGAIVIGSTLVSLATTIGWLVFLGQGD